jgi:calcineurin-like phosphoesterase family protein
MPRPRIDWVTTDWHLYHDKIIDWCDRPSDHMDLIFANYRASVADKDTVINLGDLIFKYHEMLPEILRSLPGKKVLVLGNHDRKTRGWYTRAGFDFVCDALTIGSTLFTHKPVEVLPTGITLNIHGHWHHTDKIHNEALWWSPHTHHKLSIEEARYKPVNLQKILGNRVKL